ncbi:MAG TPA: histidinol dehydrogenase [Mycobacteriales bacterium]|nr:histidinol dehydrogenase [Mycobacteriales bacterium]
MLRLIDLRAGGPTPLGATLPRAAVDVTSTAHTVEPILEAVRTHGAEAIAEYTEQFDGIRPGSLRVPAAALADAVQMLDAKVRAGLEESIRRARLVHEAQRPADAPVPVVPGGTVTNRWVPIGRVGLYVPGGRAVYPSSVVMNVVPAQVAGVPSLALASPPQPDFGGLPHPVILAAASLLGVEEVYAVGGAQAIAMFAYGVPDQVAPVDLITGPGNVYVTAAKRLVQGTVGIDAEAGPTEIAILADDDADPAYVAADLISQAEHDPLAAAVLITDSERLIGEVDRRLSDQVAATKHVERITESLSGEQSGAVLVRDLDHGLEVVNAYGAEHLQILTREPRVTAARVRNAGAVFVGPNSPVPLGDYCAGSNHVLPTGGTSRFASGLSVLAFGRSMQVIEYDEAALAATAEHVTAMAYSEDLPAHAASVQVRAARADS